MHIVTVENFLCCFKLETGGYFLGWLGAIGGVLSIVALVALGILGAVSYEAIEESIQQSFQNVTTNDWVVDLVMNSSRVYLALILIVVLLYCVVNLYACVSLIIGTKNRTAERIVPYLVITVIGIVLNFVQLATPNVDNIINVIIGTACSGYIYICVYSLYVKFKNEKTYKFSGEA